MSTGTTVYLNLREITEVHTKDVLVKDVADVYCSDQNIQNKCSVLKVKAIREDRQKRYVEAGGMWKMPWM